MSLSSSVKIGAQKLLDWKLNPVQFVNEVFGVEPDKWQIPVLKAFPSQDKDKQRIAMQACVGPGKTAVLSWCGWNFMACYGRKGDHPKGAAVAITSDNLKDNLWPEFSKWQERSEYLKRTFTWTKTRVYSKEHPETWFISARTWPKTANPDEQGRVLSGLHSGYVLYLIDESGDIPLPVLKAAEQGLSSCVWGKIMMAGNPTSHEGMLYQVVKYQANKWFIVRITSDPDDPLRTPRISLSWARDQIAQYGRENPWIMSSILGLFPPSSLNTLLSPDEVYEAMKRHLSIADYGFAQKRIGCDVARFGLDSTVLFPRQGLAAFKPEQMRGARTDEIAARLMQMKTDHKSEVEMVDDTGGWGAGVIDAYRLAGENALPVNFSSNAMDRRYFNKRTEMWWLMAQWVKKGGALPYLPDMVSELSVPTYTFRDGRIWLMEKDLIKTAIGRSPDYADSLALTFAIPEAPRGTLVPGMPAVNALVMGSDVGAGGGSRVGKTKNLGEYDPYREH